MKKLGYYVLGALLLTACGNSKQSSEADTDSIAEAAVDEMVEAVVGYTQITKDSVGGVVVGHPMFTLPDSIPGLYTHRVPDASPDAVTMIFSDNDGEQFVAYDFGEGNVDVISVVGHSVKVNSPEGEFGLGDAFTKVLALPGVETEWINLDDEGSWYWKWDGLWFAPSPAGLTEAVSRKLYNSAEAPASEDFTDAVTIGYIGTGLPF